MFSRCGTSMSTSCFQRAILSTRSQYCPAADGIDRSRVIGDVNLSGERLGRVGSFRDARRFLRALND